MFFPEHSLHLSGREPARFPRHSAARLKDFRSATNSCFDEVATGTLPKYCRASESAGKVNTHLISGSHGQDLCLHIRTTSLIGVAAGKSPCPLNTGFFSCICDDFLATPSEKLLHVDGYIHRGRTVLYRREDSDGELQTSFDRQGSKLCLALSTLIGNLIGLQLGRLEHRSSGVGQLNQYANGATGFN
ncbi:hypothetical protein B0H10DRAFT_2229126 [Mycena sp. CBHHK59/15]|nr:hypothetical protein B0H10DRAFT_2229126 [Mycena sp. CBHHK59/15]